MVFTNKLVLDVLTSSGQSLLFSTYQPVNKLSMNEIGVPLIKFTKFDTNQDGLIDSMNFRVEFRSNITDVKNIKLLASFDYSLSKLLKMEMKGLISVDVDTPNGASAVLVSGDMLLSQSSPVLIDSVPRTLFNTDPIDDYVNYSI